MVGVVVNDAATTRLNRCSFVVRPGEVLGLVGATGCGKSTALEVAAGLRTPDRGRILLEGRDVTRRVSRLRSAVGLMGHDTPGPHDETARRWLRIWGQLDAVPHKDQAKLIDGALTRFGLQDARERPVSRLSRGERKRLQLARLWVRRPSVLLLDGPEDGLDGVGLRQISAAIRELTARGTTVVLTSTSPHFPATVCDRAVCMDAGAAVAEVQRQESEFKNRIAEIQGWAT